MVLQIEKNDNAIYPGSSVSYKLVYKNLSDSRLTGVIVTMALPEEFTFSLLTSGVYDEKSHVLTLNLGILDPYSVGTIAVSGNITSNAQVGKAIVASALVGYTVPSTNTNDEASAYVVSTIGDKDNNGSTINTSSTVSNSPMINTGAKKVIGLSGAHGFMPSSLVEWLALATILLIIFILIRSIYVSYKDENSRR